MQESIPLTDSLAPVKPAQPCVLVIFGITGDLTKRLLYPSLCNLGSKGLLADNVCMVGVSSEPHTTESFRTKLNGDIDTFVQDAEAKRYGLDLCQRIHYVAGKFDDPSAYEQLKNQLGQLKQAGASDNYLFYFATPPEFFKTITSHLHQVGLLTEQAGQGCRRIVIEKPFGHDLASAKALNKSLLALIKEEQIFRIDHYLGKETVRNLMAFRFSNGIFEPLWNQNYIDHVQITLAETLGVELRGGYYERAGALRDMVPNHLLQLLSLIAMEPPTAFTAEHIRNEKTKALQAVSVLTAAEVPLKTVRGQYAAGLIEECMVSDYRSEPRVDSQSATETFVALKLSLNNWRWLNVPFYVRTGKRMKKRASEIVIQFKAGPSGLFGGSEQGAIPNLLRIFIQPDEGISLQFNAKLPGPTMQLGQVDMKFKYSDYFGATPQTGYEAILYDCMNGDHLLFNNSMMIETGWALVQPLLDHWAQTPPSDFPNYAAGSWGPKEAADLLKQDGRRWLL